MGFQHTSDVRTYVVVMAARTTTRSAATERAYLHFARAPHGAAAVVPTAAAGTGDEDFDEADIWGAFAPVAAPADPPRARRLPAARNKAPGDGGRAAAHGSLPVKIPDWSKILGHAYRPAAYRGGAGDWEVDDDDGSMDAMVPPHELVWRRRAASLSLSLNGVPGRTLRVRDAVWKQTTGFQD